MGVITIIIAAVISIGISYGFYIAGKKEDKLEKVRRYADKRQQEFEAFFKAQIKEITEMKAALSTGNMQAEAAVKRFETQFAQFKELTGNVEKDSKAVQNIEAKIKSYDNALEELVNMTAGVEENIEQVRKESALIDSFFKKIQEQTQRLDAIENHIPKITEKFQETNEAKLKILGSSLLKEYKKQNDDFVSQNDEKNKALRETLEEIKNDAQETFNSFKAQINSVYSSASEKAQALEDEAFKHLSEQAQKRADKFTKDIDEAIFESRKNLENTLLENEKTLNQKILDVN